MKRCSDQAKLFFFGLLRTVSALATTAEHHTALTNGPYSASEVSQHPLTLRLARRTDVPSIQRCNLATLPENYNQQFYVNHLRQWPDSALCVVDENAADSMSSTPFHPFPQAAGQDEKVVAYVLGKVEERAVLKDNDEESFLESIAAGKTSAQLYTTQRLGHVTSLAVLEPYRRRGLALELMKQLHYHLQMSHRVSSVGLHVRQSNRAATGLYSDVFGYDEAECIPNYYQDGEDAYFMVKTFEQEQERRNSFFGGGSNSGGGLFKGLRRATPLWESGPSELRLPRMVGVPDPLTEEEEEEVPELMTGTF